MGISPFSSLDFFIRVLLLDYRLFYREYIYIYIYIYIYVFIILYIYICNIYIYIIRNKYYKHCCCIRPFLNVIKGLLVYNPDGETRWRLGQSNLDV